MSICLTPAATAAFTKSTCSGVFAAGPYNCAGHSNYTACMYNATISSSMLNTMQADINNWSGTANDSKSLVAGQKVADGAPQDVVRNSEVERAYLGE